MAVRSRRNDPTTTPSNNTEETKPDSLCPDLCLQDFLHCCQSTFILKLVCRIQIVCELNVRSSHLTSGVKTFFSTTTTDKGTTRTTECRTTSTAVLLWGLLHVDRLLLLVVPLLGRRALLVVTLLWRRTLLVVRLGVSIRRLDPGSRCSNHTMFYIYSCLWKILVTERAFYIRSNFDTFNAALQ